MGSFETVPAPRLSYDRTSRQYQFNWRTERSWEGTCGLLSLRLDDGTIHTAQYYFN
jgi:hypothetical protein